ncbi:unnamed protein product [Prunus armeniaca]
MRTQYEPLLHTYSRRRHIPSMEPALVPTPLASTDPAPPPPIELAPAHPMCTCLRNGVSQPKNYTNGTVRYPIPRALLNASKHLAWRAAMSEEINALLWNQTGSLVPPTPAHTPVGCKWVFYIKRHFDGIIEIYKARLVPKGFHQRRGIDYFETFSHVVKPATIRTVLSLAVSRRWSLRQLDVKNAFLYGFLEEDVPRAWFNRISTFVLSLSFSRSLVVSHDGALHLNQIKYVHDLLHKSNLLHAKPASTPLATKPVLTASDGDLLTSPTKYHELVGSLQYITLTHPDISFAINTVAQFMSYPRSPHMVAIKRILHYVKIDFGLHFTPQGPSTRLIVYSDVDWAGCPDSRRSTTGYLIYLGSNLISWCSKKQPTVSRYSAESKYHALGHACAESLGSVLYYMNWVFDCLFQFS